MREDSPLGCNFSPEFQDLTFAGCAAEMGENATAIYFMWGSNITKGVTAEDYIRIVEYLLEVCPNATIHMQLIPAGRLPYKDINKIILEAYAHFQESGERRVFLVDTCTAIGSATSSDGIHLWSKGNERWYACLVAHAQEYSLVP